MPRCAFLTLEDAQGYVIDDHLARDPLGRLGWTVDAVPWRTVSDWTSWDLIVLRSTWDYHEAPAEFLGVLEGIRGAGIPLFNPLHLTPVPTPFGVWRRPMPTDPSWSNPGSPP